jgi:hypothetical protein
MMDDRGRRDTGRAALALGAVVVGSIGCISAYAIVGGPFGTLNDIGNASIGVLGAVLAVRLSRQARGSGGGVALAIAGATVAVAGSALVISGRTGWFLAGLVSTVGLAGIGAWLFGVSSGPAAATWPRSLRRLGILAGGLMAAGIAAAPGVALGLDDAATAPAWAWLALTSWLGTYVALPIWAVRFGRRATRTLRSDELHVEAAGVA